MKQYILIELLTRCGEYEFTTYLKRCLPADKTLVEGLKNELAKFYPGKFRVDGEWVYHNGGETSTKCVKTTLISKDQYDLLCTLL